jgi:hypothetical protein
MPRISIIKTKLIIILPIIIIAQIFAILIQIIMQIKLPIIDIFQFLKKI